MSKHLSAIAAIALAACSAAWCTSARSQVVDPLEGAHVAQSSQEFEASAAEQVSILLSTGFEKSLRTAALGATSNQEMNALVEWIKREDPIDGISPGSLDVSYDIILQPGHYGRTKGRVGTTGARVSERALNAHLVRLISQELTAGGLRILVIPADGAASGLKSKIFLAIHADGSAKPCSTGPSLAYADKSSLFAMHTIGFALSAAYGYDYTDFRKDNFTADLADYYMFRKVNTTALTGLLEIGELTCKRSEDRLLASFPAVSHNVAQALKLIVALKPE